MADLVDPQFYETGGYHGGDDPPKRKVVNVVVQATFVGEEDALEGIDVRTVGDDLILNNVPKEWWLGEPGYYTLESLTWTG